MTDIDSEKVVKGLKSCSEVDCTECQYGTEGHGHSDCIERLCADTLAFVVEQEQATKEKDGTISNLIAQIKEISQCYERVVRCKDCDNRECDGRAGTIVCGITGESHDRLWFCADGERKEGR